VEAEAHAMLRMFAGIAAERRVRLEIAVPRQLTLHTDPAAFREVLGALLTHAIHAATNSRVLLGAMSHAGWVQIVVTDEGTGADLRVQDADLAPARQLAALQGGILEIDYRVGEGTTVLLRLPGP
jgi:signal transduction histidine kinase